MLIQPTSLCTPLLELRSAPLIISSQLELMTAKVEVSLALAASEPFEIGLLLLHMTLHLLMILCTLITLPFNRYASLSLPYLVTPFVAFRINWAISFGCDTSDA